MTMVTFHQNKNITFYPDVLFHEVSVKCIRLVSSDVSADVKDYVQKYPNRYSS